MTSLHESAAHPLARLRLKLTAWYAATLVAILALLGGGLFLTIRRQISQQLEASLQSAITELEHAARIREMEARSARGTVVDAVEELRIPDRALYLFDASGTPVKPDTAADWIRTAAAQATTAGTADVRRWLPNPERTLRLRAERFTLDSGTPMVAVAVADLVELEDQYASLIAAFGGAAAVALLLVAGGGWLLVRKSTAPVEDSIERMRRFMADAAHELRTPITVVRSRAEVALQRERPAGEYAAALQGIEHESVRLGRIVEDLMILARADSGDRPVTRERVFLDDVALDATGAARAVADAAQVTVAVDEFEEAPVAGDPELLRQLVMILLDNAVKFTGAGGEVRVRVGARDGRPTVEVRDTGCGIPAADLPRIYDRFWRGDPARSRGATNGGNGSDGGRSGAGLGLSIARWIADAHDAEIHVESVPGAGSRFMVVFPPYVTGAQATASAS